MTDTELRLIAALAIIGLSRRPNERIEHARGDGHAERVVDEREEQVLADVPHRCAREAAGAHDAAEVALDEGDAGALHRHVGPGAHGDAHVGLGQRGGVVDAVAGHGDDAALGLQALDRLGLPRRAGPRRSTSSIPSVRATASAVVRLSPVSMTTRTPSALRSADGFGRRFLDGIGHAEEARHGAVDAEEHHGLPVARGALGAGGQLAAGRRPSRPGAALPSATTASADSTPVTPWPVTTGTHPPRAGAAPRSAAPARTAAASGCSLACSSPAARASTSAFGKAGRGGDGHQPGLALGERAGLVDDHGVDLLHRLEGLGVLDQHAGLRAAPRRPP